MLVFQLRVADWPAPIVDGVAVRVTLRMLTVAVDCAITPPAPVAFAVYVVVAVGVTVAEPLSARVVWSSPRMEGVMETEVALVLVQVSVAGCPAATTCGEMLMVIAGAEPAGTTVTVIDDVAALPLASVAVAT